MRYDQIYDRINSLCEERGWSQYKLIHEENVERLFFSFLWLFLRWLLVEVLIKSL